jgi:beta-phosphoglucomutase family hydrolase
MSSDAEQVPFGAVFDWDGVIIDSAELHQRSWLRLADEISKEIMPDTFIRGFGMRNEQIIPQIYGWTRDAGEIERLSLRKEELYRELVRNAGITPLPGVAGWIQRLKIAGIPRLVASSTPRLNIDAILDLLGLCDAFDAIVSAEDVRHGKPHPEIFLNAAARMKMPPERAVVFEDAHVGIEAAHAAGMRVIAITTTHPVEQLSAADLVVKSFDELTVERVAELVRSAL